MKLILRDHLKRWGWAFGLVFLIQFLFADFSMKSRGGFHVEFFMIAFLGPFLLSSDLQRGHARALLTLPLIPKEIARAWWLATVAIPALLLAAATALGVGVFSFARGLPVTNLESYVLGWLMSLLWLGSSFFALTGLPSAGWQGNWWDKVCGGFFTALWGLSIGGIAFLIQSRSSSNFLRLRGLVIVNLP